MKKYIVLINLITMSALQSTQLLENVPSQQNYTIIYPVLTVEKMKTLKEWLNYLKGAEKIERGFDSRILFTWDYFRIKPQIPISELIERCDDDFPVFTVVDDNPYKPNPESIFDYPEISSIILEDIIPQILKVIPKLTAIPQEKLLVRTEFHQLYITKNIRDQPNDIHWHQDPGTNYGFKSDYTTVIMLSDQNDPKHGWDGGKFLLKPGLPAGTTDFVTLTPRYNQAILFNNKENSHAVTKITKNEDQETERSILIVEFYLQEPSPEEKIMKF